MAKESQPIDHIVIGLDDATPNTMQEANKRRWKMWSEFMTVQRLQIILLSAILAVELVQLLK
jgi:hypothetical protein